MGAKPVSAQTIIKASIRILHGWKTEKSQYRSLVQRVLYYGHVFVQYESRDHRITE